MLSSQLFATAQFSQKKYGFRGAGGTSTAIIDSPFRTRGGGGIPASRLYNAPYFDATDPEDRNNQQITGSLSYYLSSPSARQPRHQGRRRALPVAVHRRQLADVDRLRVLLELRRRCGGQAALQPRRHADARGSSRAPRSSTTGCAARGAGIDITTTSFYAQDQWAATRQLTLDLGMRYEQVRSEATGDIIGADTNTWCRVWRRRMT